MENRYDLSDAIDLKAQNGERGRFLIFTAAKTIASNHADAVRMSRFGIR